MRFRHRLIAALIVGAVTYGGAALLARLHLALAIRTVLVFAIAKCAGDLVGLIMTGFAEMVFYEDFLRELSVYIVLGLITAAAISVGSCLTGTEVTPAVPAAAVYILFLFVPHRRRGIGNEPY